MNRSDTGSGRGNVLEMWIKWDGRMLNYGLAGRSQNVLFNLLLVYLPETYPPAMRAHTSTNTIRICDAPDVLYSLVPTAVGLKYSCPGLDWEELPHSINSSVFDFFEKFLD